MNTKKKPGPESIERKIAIGPQAVGSTSSP